MITCVHCEREIVWEPQADRWIDQEATGDDVLWREHCESHDTFNAEHEPRPYETPVPTFTTPEEADAWLEAFDV